MSDASLPSTPPSLCRNCNTIATSNFCPACGQSTEFELTPRTLLFGNAPRTDLRNNPWIRTVLLLSTRPGYIAREFCEGRRIQYVHPLKYFLLLTTIGFFLITFTDHRSDILPSADEFGSGEFDQAAKWVIYKMFDHTGVVTAALLPILAMLMQRLFRRHHFSLSQTMVLCLYVYGQSFLIQDLATALGAMRSTLGNTLVNLVPFALLCLGAVQFYSEPAWKSVIKAFLAHALFYVAYAVLISLAAGAVALFLYLIAH